MSLPWPTRREFENNLFDMLWQIKELENKLRVQEQQLQCTHDCTDAVRATPNEGKTYIRDEFMNDRILRSSNSVNRSMNQGSVRGNDSLHETRRKREQLRSADTENNIFVPSSLNDTKVTRKSDPPKISRVMRTTKLVTAAQGPLTHKRTSTSRDQAQGVKERDAKKKIWSR